MLFSEPLIVEPLDQTFLITVLAQPVLPPTILALPVVWIPLIVTLSAAITKSVVNIDSSVLVPVLGLISAFAPLIVILGTLIVAPSYVPGTTEITSPDSAAAKASDNVRYPFSPMKKLLTWSYLATNDRLPYVPAVIVSTNWSPLYQPKKLYPSLDV